MNDRNRRARIKRVAEKVAQRANEAARKNPKPQCDAPIKEDVTLLWHSANNVAAIHLGHSRPSWIDETFRQLTECIRGGCSNLEYTRAEYAERIPLVPDADFIGRAVVLCDLDYRPLIDLIERIGTERAWAVLIDKAEPELVPVTSVQAAVDQVRAAVMRQEADSKQGIIEKHNALVPDAVAGRKSRTGGSKGGKKKHANKTKRVTIQVFLL